MSSPLLVVAPAHILLHMMELIPIPFSPTHPSTALTGSLPYSLKASAYWGDTKIDPSGNTTLAYARAVTPPTEPANNASHFSIHNSRVRWTYDLKSAQIANFDELVGRLSRKRNVYRCRHRYH